MVAAVVVVVVAVVLDNKELSGIGRRKVCLVVRMLMSRWSINRQLKLQRALAKQHDAQAAAAC